MTMLKLAAAFAVAALGVTHANAAVIGVTGDFLEIAQPATVTDAAPGSNTNILVFNERQGVVLTSALSTDGGTIAAGTRVDSHMFFLNRASGSGTLTLSGSVTFDGEIIGTMSDVNGALLSASDFLGAPTTYTNFPNRGLENNDLLSASGATATATLLVSQPGDWVRVVTISPIPLPAGGILLLAALGGLGFAGRRKLKAS